MTKRQDQMYYDAHGVPVSARRPVRESIAFLAGAPHHAEVGVDVLEPPRRAVSLLRPLPWMIHDGMDVLNRNWWPGELPGRIALYASPMPPLQGMVDWLMRVREGEPFPSAAWQRGLVATAEMGPVHLGIECNPKGKCSPWGKGSEDAHWPLRRVRWLPEPLPVQGRDPEGLTAMWTLPESDRELLRRLDTAPPAECRPPTPASQGGAA